MAERPTEGRHPASDGLHRLAAADALARLLDAQAAALGAVRPALPAIARAAEAAAEAIRAGRKLAYAGAGSSGLMALADALELAGTFGILTAQTPVLLAGGAASLLDMAGGVEDGADLAAEDFARAGLARGDVVVCVAASGGTPYTLAVARLARDAGATVAGLANAPGSALLELADIPILLDTGPEVLSGSTRLGAGTAQKAALNLLSTLMGLRLGHAHDGYMVNVRADNAKLRDRAARIVAAIAARPLDTAQEALARAGGHVKAAVLVARGATPDQARAALDAAGGHLDRALAAPEQTQGEREP